LQLWYKGDIISDFGTHERSSCVRVLVNSTNVFWTRNFCFLSFFNSWICVCLIGAFTCLNESVTLNKIFLWKNKRVHCPKSMYLKCIREYPYFNNILFQFLINKMIKKRKQFSTNTSYKVPHVIIVWFLFCFCYFSIKI
jgi:hypothetical protein